MVDDGCHFPLPIVHRILDRFRLERFIRLHGFGYPYSGQRKRNFYFRISTNNIGTNYPIFYSCLDSATQSEHNIFRWYVRTCFRYVQLANKETRIPSRGQKLNATKSQY